MEIKYSNLIAILTFAFTVLLSQMLDRNNLTYNNLKPIIENAYRSQQVVWVEDFTGLN